MLGRVHSQKIFACRARRVIDDSDSIENARDQQAILDGVQTAWGFRMPCHHLVFAARRVGDISRLHGPRVHSRARSAQAG